MLSFSHLIASLALLSSVPHSAFAVNICAYSSRNCGGTSGCCSSIPANVCCGWSGSTYGWSVQFSNMPVGTPWFGNTYADSTCQTMTGGGGGSGSSTCLSVWNAPNYLNWHSARWTANGRAGGAQAQVEGDGNCRQPDVVGYSTTDGDEHLIKVPEGQLEHVERLIASKDFKALEAFQPATL